LAAAADLLGAVEAPLEVAVVVEALSVVVEYTWEAADRNLLVVEQIQY